MQSEVFSLLSQVLEDMGDYKPKNVEDKEFIRDSYNRLLKVHKVLAEGVFKNVRKANYTNT